MMEKHFLSSKTALQVILALILLLLPSPAFGAGQTASCLPNASKGEEYTISSYVGQDDSYIYCSSQRQFWDLKDGPDYGPTQSLFWRIRTDLKSIAPIPESEFFGIEERLKTWESSLPNGEKTDFKIVRGTVQVGNLPLFQIPEWEDGTGEMETTAWVESYPASEHESVYGIRYSTLPKGAVPPHYYATDQMVVVRNQKAHALQKPNGEFSCTPDVVLPVKSGGYLCYGRSTLPIAFTTTPDYREINLSTVLRQKLRLPDTVTPRALGLRNNSALYWIPNGKDIRKSAIYEVNSDLTIRKCPESLESLRIIDSASDMFMGSDGTIFLITANGEMLYDLTHKRSLDLFGGQSAIGSFMSDGTGKAVLRSGRALKLPVYFYKGFHCFRAEDFNGRGYSMQWDPVLRETRFLSSSASKTAFPTLLKSGPVYRSDVLILFDGVPVTSYNTGGNSLVPIYALENAGVLNYSQ